MGTSVKRTVICGQPYTDALFKEPVKVSIIDKNQFNILYAPTWRQHADVKLFPFEDFNKVELEDFLEKNNIHIFVRFHPAYEESIPADILEMKNISLFSAKEYTEVMDYINNFDALITDYSSIYIDYMPLETGFVMDYMENTPGPKPSTQKDFIKELKKIKENPEDYIKQIHELNLKLNSSDKNSCKRLGEIIKKQ